MRPLGKQWQTTTLLASLLPVRFARSCYVLPFCFVAANLHSCATQPGSLSCNQSTCIFPRMKRHTRSITHGCTRRTQHCSCATVHVHSSSSADDERYYCKHTISFSPVCVEMMKTLGSMLGFKSPRQRHPVVLTRDQWGPAGPLHSSWLDHGSATFQIILCSIPLCFFSSLPLSFRSHINVLHTFLFSAGLGLELCTQTDMHTHTHTHTHTHHETNATNVYILIYYKKNKTLLLSPCLS